MKQNIHNVERVIRMVIGIALLSQVFLGIQSLWFVLGIMPFLTGAIAWCPPYAMLGFNSCAVTKKRASIKKEHQ